MPFSFGGPEFPISLKITRSLVYTEASILFIIALFLVAIDVTIPNSTTLSSGQIVGLAALFLALGGGVVYLGVVLSQLHTWTRNAILGVQVLLLAYSALRVSSDTWESFILILILVGGVVWSLFAPTSRAAFAGTSTTSDSASSEPSSAS